MRFAVSQSNYIPWIGYFDLISQVDVFVIYDTVQYTKNDWRNRNRILSQAGPIWLTVPVNHQSSTQLINETLIANQKWQRKHWMSIEQSYKKSPFFEMYRSGIKVFYEQEWTLLSELNRYLILHLVQLLGIDTKIICSSELAHCGDKNSRLISFAKQLDSNSYISGPAAKSYIDLEKFKQSSIDINWIDYSGYEPYQQCFDGFVSNLSVLDLLFNIGPDAMNYLKRSTL